MLGCHHGSQQQLLHQLVVEEGHRQTAQAALCLCHVIGQLVLLLTPDHDQSPSCFWRHGAAECASWQVEHQSTQGSVEGVQEEDIAQHSRLHLE